MAVDDRDQPTVDFRPDGAEIEAEDRQIGLAGEPPDVPEKEPVDFAAALKDATIAGLIALALAGPMVGLVTDPGPDKSLILQERWASAAIVVAVVFFGRLLLNLFVWRKQRIPKPAKARPRTAPGAGSGLTGIATAAFLGLAIVLPIVTIYAFPGQSRYVIDLGTLILTYVMLGWGLNIVVGLAGLLDLGYVAFYAVGAYSYALIATYFGWSFWVCLPLAGLLAALWGIALGFPVLRLRGDYLAIVTLAFGEIIRLVLLNWNEFTGGPAGIGQIPRPSFFGLPFNREPGGFADVFGLPFSSNHRIVFLYYLILALALVTCFVTVRIRNLPIGRAWEALREDEIACRSLGINTTNTKLTAFAIGAMFGGFAGSFFATRQGFISPESFNFMESATILAIVVLGGLGSQLGVAIAATVMIGGIELLRNLSFLKVVFGENFDPSQYRLLAFGLLMVAIMIWRPRGLISSRRPSVFLRERKSVSADLVPEGRG
jgi:branched-chain amino acid transport system permease protein